MGASLTATLPLPLSLGRCLFLPRVLFLFFLSFGQDTGFVFEISCDISSVKCQIEFIDNALRSSPALRQTVAPLGIQSRGLKTGRQPDWEINQLLAHKFASQVAKGPLLRNLWNAQSAPAAHKSVLSGSSKATFEYANCYLSQGAL